MKVIKVLIAILVVLLLIVSSTLLFVYESLHYSLLSYDENIAALSDEALIEEAVEEFANTKFEDIEGINDALEDKKIADFNTKKLAKFFESAFENSLAYLFLEEDEVEEFDKRFIDDFKENTIEAAFENMTQDPNYDLFVENLQYLDQESSKDALTQLFDSIPLKYEDDDIDKFAATLYEDGNPNKEKLKEAFVDFANDKVKIKFNPEELVEKALYLPRTINEELDTVFGMMLLIDTGLLILLLIFVLFSRNGVFICLSITSLFSVGALQLLRIFRSDALLEQLEESNLFSNYYDAMSGLLTRNINYISIGVLAFLVLFLILNIILNKVLPERDEDDPKYRFRIVRVILSLVLIAGLTYFNYNNYMDVKEINEELESYDLEEEFDDLSDFEGVFEFEIDF